MAAESETIRGQIRSAAHDLRNIAYRLAFLTENLQKEMPPSPARTEASDLLADSSNRLNGIAERLRRLATPES